jgi:shikimate kinase
MSSDGGGPRRVVLVGFMGAGKTTVGRRLAARLGWRFVDLDRRVETRTGRRVAELFAERGEAGFRAEELDAARELAQADACVVAAGGGAWVQDATRAALQQGALSVWLDADFETLVARLPRDGSRPLVSSRERMRALLEARRPAYGLADLRVDAGPTPDVVAGRIEEALAARRGPSDEGR